ncbi:XRE family transcriptional regulator [candidate division WS5 bacterium]|uniref:XRE family transcriptional regulator n=1 Tax=candidate division WS5 bacterium TaxID=2093353 RepID=A0A419DDM5_9BACT|nr:MAG: XRE family transcriptional regulator [candidate division WS5 bacterium]
MTKKKQGIIKASAQGDKELKKIIGSRIQRVRRHLGRTADWVARGIGVSRGAITQVENGRNNISATLLWKIATVLECDIKEFFPNVPDAKTLDQADIEKIGKENERAADYARKAFKPLKND